MSKTKSKRLPTGKRTSGPSRELVFALAAAALLLIVAGAFLIARVAAPSEQRASPTPTPAPLVSIPPPPTPAPSFTAAPGGPQPVTLDYLQTGQTGTVLNQIDLRTGRISRLFRAPGGSGISAPANGDNVAYAMIRTASGKEVPSGSGARGTEVIHVRNLRTGRDIRVGEGFRPMWSWDGTRLAALRVAGQGSAQVVAMTINHPHLRPVTPPGSDWTIMGWAGDRLLLFGVPLRLYLVGLDGSHQQIPTPDAVIRDPSPDGKWVFALSHQGDAVFQPLGGRKPVVIDLGPWQLGASYWTGNDLVVAAAATGTEVSAPSTVLVLDPANGSMLEVPDTQGAVAAFPAPDGASFVLVRGKFPPTWKLWTCRFSGTCARAGDVRIGVAPVRAG